MKREACLNLNTPRSLCKKCYKNGGYDYGLAATVASSGRAARLSRARSLRRAAGCVGRHTFSRQPNRPMHCAIWNKEQIKGRFQRSSWLRCSSSLYDSTICDLYLHFKAEACGDDGDGRELCKKQEGQRHVAAAGAAEPVGLRRVEGAASCSEHTHAHTHTHRQTDTHTHTHKHKHTSTHIHTQQQQQQHEDMVAWFDGCLLQV